MEMFGQNGCPEATGEGVVPRKVVHAIRGCSYEVMRQLVDSVTYVHIYLNKLIFLDKNYNHNCHLDLFK